MMLLNNYKITQYSQCCCYTTLEILAHIAESDRLIMAALSKQVSVCPLVIQVSLGVGLGMVGL